MAYGYDVKVTFPSGITANDDQLAKLNASMRSLGPEWNARIKRTVDRAAVASAAILRAELPEDTVSTWRTGGGLKKSVSIDGQRYSPGGIGAILGPSYLPVDRRSLTTGAGGGQYVSTVSFGTSYSNYVFEGTGLYGKYNKPIRQRMGGKPVTFGRIKYGKNPSNWISYSAGQKPQTKAITDARRAANRIMSRTIFDVKAGINSRKDIADFLAKSASNRTTL